MRILWLTSVKDTANRLKELLIVQCSKLFKTFSEIFDKAKLSVALNELLTVHKGAFGFFLLQGKLHLSAISKVTFIAHT